MTSEIIPYALPFAKPITLGGRRYEVREGCLVSVRLGDRTGWGECAPLPGFSDETLDEALADLRIALVALAEGGVPRPKSSAAACALDAALQGLAEAGATEVNHLGYVPMPHRSTQSVNAVLLESEPPEQAVVLADRGYRAVKIKVGGDPLLAAKRVRRAAATRASLRLDANRAWTLPEAKAFFSALGPIDIEYIEEPAATLDDCRALAFEGVPVALDESLRGLTLEEIEALEWPSAFVLKPMILGGLRRTRQIAETALKANITPVVSSAIETAVGLRALAAFAASIGPEDVPAGLGTSRLFGASNTEPAFSQSPQVSVDEPFTVVLP